VRSQEFVRYEKIRFSLYNSRKPACQKRKKTSACKTAKKPLSQFYGGMKGQIRSFSSYIGNIQLGRKRAYCASCVRLFLKKAVYNHEYRPFILPDIS